MGDEKKPDPTFLAALPPDLRAEVEAQFRQKRREARSASDIARKQEQCLEMVQPTPNEDGVEKRKGSTSFSLEVEEASGSKSKELQPRKASPISTQLDPQFMAEMPADIREELEEHQRERERMKVEDKRMKVKEAEALSPAEVSFSQLDPEVLAALPDEMMEEVRDQYKRRKEEKEREMVGGKIALDTGSNEKTAFDALMRSKPGPSMKSSPAKLIKGKRGRPKGSV